MHTHARPLAALLLLVSFGSSPWAQTPPTAPLNDTGQTQCYNTLHVAAACDEATVGNTGTMPGQDARYGRDAAQAKGKLLPAKTGGGAAGFDFTALDASGAVTTTLGSHDCVKDNVTGLIWSTETLGGQTWTAANTSYPSSGTGTYTRCGYATGWRLPTRNELLSIVHRGATSSPVIDTNYFPVTQSDYYWAAEPYANVLSNAWAVRFDNGYSGNYAKTNTYYVRLVRSGQ